MTPLTIDEIEAELRRRAREAWKRVQSAETELACYAEKCVFAHTKSAADWIAQQRKERG